MGWFQLYPYNSVVLSLCVREVVIEGFRLIMLVKSVVIVHVINLQYISVIRVVDINYKCYSYGV